MQYSNLNLIEVNCGFQFPEESVNWDSTYFGLFYEKIKSFGFDQKEERKGFQITFNAALLNSGNESLTSSSVEDQVVFKNNQKYHAILLGKNRISFHIVQNYLGWESFLKEFIVPYYEIYKSLGLGNGKRQCSIVYLNRFAKEETDNLSEYFKIISHIEPAYGKEVMTFVQRMISNDDNLLIAKLNSNTINNKQIVNLECGAICINSEYINSSDWVNQAVQTHKPILEFFEGIITEKLKQEL